MNGMTISEMAGKLKLPHDTVRRRLQRAGCKPFSQEALYTDDDFKKISKVRDRGRPPKAKAEPKPASKVKKAK